MVEIWQPIDQFEDIYLISSLGRIKRIKGGKGAKVNKILKPYTNKITGYQYITLSKNCIQQDFLIHRLVCNTFFDKSDLQVNHKNGIKSDNNIVNLEYMSASQNLLHATSCLKQRTGEKHWNSRLKIEDVRKIRSLKHSGLTHEQIAKDFNVSRPTISEILSGRKWKNII